jgi:hypothetical protein
MQNMVKASFEQKSASRVRAVIDYLFPNRQRIAKEEARLYYWKKKVALEPNWHWPHLYILEAGDDYTCFWLRSRAVTSFDDRQRWIQQWLQFCLNCRKTLETHRTSFVER